MFPENGRVHENFGVSYVFDMICACFAEGNITEYEYDANGNLVKAVMGDSVTIYEYDAENRITAMHTGSEGNKHTQTFEYDHFGNVLKTTDELGFVEEYTYDLNGNVLTYVDKNGTVVYNTYDALNRVLNTRNSKDDTSFAYTYDGAGQLIKVNDTEYSYNFYGELVKQTENGISQNYSYNSLGNRVSYSLANGNVTEMQIAYGYDNSARLSKVSSVLGDQLYTYDNANRLLRSKNSISGISSEYTYYPSGNIKSLTQYNGAKTTDRVSYQYNRNGFRTVEKGINTDKAYTYDDQNRLYESFDGELLSVYSYDDFGNIKTIKSFAGTVGSVTNYIYDRNNRLTARFIDGIKTEYSYDRQGNLVSEKNEIGSISYHYNGFNRLTSVFGNNLEAKYTYDHAGLRTSKNVDGVYTGLVNDGQNVVAQYVDGRASHFYRGSSLIGYTNSTGDINFYQFNAHGDVVSILDCFGNTVRSYDYDAFGKQKDDIDRFYRNQHGTATDDNPFRNCGEYFDGETGLIYLRARYYNPDIQRFVAEDTHWNPNNMIFGDKNYYTEELTVSDVCAILQSSNLYVYCMNNPIKYIDTFGTLAYPGQIHNLVVNEIASIYGFYKEQTINYSLGWGRADLISSDGAVWDVKRDKPNQIASGVKQVNKYVSNEWKNNPDIDLHVGGYIESGSFVVTINVDTYYIDYRYAENGVIAYDYHKVTDWEEVGNYAKATAGVVIAGACIYGIYQSGGALAPVLLPVAEKAVGG